MIPTFQELEDHLVGIVTYLVSQGGGILRADQEYLEPSKRILMHIDNKDEIVNIAKDFIRQVND